MSNLISVLDYTIDHMTDDQIFDVQLVSSEGIDGILPIFLTSTDMAISSCEFRFKSNFDIYNSRSYFSNEKGWALFSKKLTSIVLGFIPDCIYYDAYIDQNPKGEFFLLKIPEYSDIVNKESSVFETDVIFKDSFSAVKKLVFKENIETAAMFRIYEFPLTIFVTKDLRGAIESADLKGIKFTLVQEYQWSIFNV